MNRTCTIPSSQASQMREQLGMSQIMVLLLIALLSLLALTGTRVSILEERMASNTQDRTLAFNAAEAGLRDCETILQGAALPPFNNTNGMYQPAAAGSPPRWESIDWSAANAVRIHPSPPAGVAEAPRCIIEEMPAQPNTGGSNSLAAGKPLPDASTYRVTARGVGAKPGTIVMLQSTYVR